MDDERLVVEVENMSNCMTKVPVITKTNSKKVIAWRAIALEIGSSGDFLHLYCSAAVAPPPVGARGVRLTRVKCAPCRCGAVGERPLHRDSTGRVTASVTAAARLGRDFALLAFPPERYGSAAAAVFTRDHEIPR
ncbi:unnamed protein product [Boreogadus saida]